MQGDSLLRGLGNFEPPSPLQLSPKNILPSSCMNYHRTLQLWMNTFNAIDTTRLEIVREMGRVFKK